MPITVSNRRDGEWIGDFSTWLRSNAADNEEQQDRLRRNLRLALEQELTPRQKEMVALYFHQRMTIPQIAKEALCEPLHRLPHPPQGQGPPLSLPPLRFVTFGPRQADFPKGIRYFYPPFPLAVSR